MDSHIFNLARHVGPQSFLSNHHNSPQFRYLLRGWNRRKVLLKTPGANGNPGCSVSCHGFFRGNWNVGRSYSLHGASGNWKKIVENKVREVDTDHDFKLYNRVRVYPNWFVHQKNIWIWTPPVQIIMLLRGILISSFWGGPRLFWTITILSAPTNQRLEPPMKGCMNLYYAEVYSLDVLGFLGQLC